MQSLELLRPSRPMDAVATVLASTFITPTIKSIYLRLDAPSFSFLPGQSVWPKFERQGQQFSKIYSIASSPQHCPEIELCVSRVGWSSAYLQDLAIGQTIAVRGPYGLLTLNQLPSRPRLYLAEGSGIAPLKSQIDWLRDCGHTLPIWLVQANPETPDQLPYDSHWRSLQQEWPAFHYLPVYGPRPENALSTLPLNPAAVDVEICAVGARPAQLQQAVLCWGAKAERIRSESFFAF